jgi:hypothetical protein
MTRGEDQIRSDPCAFGPVWFLSMKIGYSCIDVGGKVCASSGLDFWVCGFDLGMDKGNKIDWLG